MNVELHGVERPTSMRVVDPRGRGQTLAIYDCQSRKAEDIVLSALANGQGADPHRETWPLRKYGRTH